MNFSLFAYSHYCLVGKNDGSVKGVTYFQCNQNYGVFLKPQLLQLVFEKVYTYVIVYVLVFGY